MEKMMWTKPEMNEVAFAANEYVAGCYTLRCALPGISSTEVEENSADSPYYAEYWVGTRRGEEDWILDSYHGSSKPSGEDYDAWDWSMGPLHGSCAHGSSSYNEDTRIAYESSKPSATIWDVVIGTLVNGNIFNATWKSSEKGVNSEDYYSHVGFGYLNEDRPNHS